MSVFRTTALAVIAAACLSSTAHAEVRDPVSTWVRYTDLNMNRAEDRAKFDKRVRRAADVVCTPQGGGWRMLNDAKRCKSEMQADARTKVAAIAARSSGLVLASADVRR